MVVVYFIVAGMCWNGGQRVGRRKGERWGGRVRKDEETE